jgi:hypothetical protein
MEQVRPCEGTFFTGVEERERLVAAQERDQPIHGNARVHAFTVGGTRWPTQVTTSRDTGP